MSQNEIFAYSHIVQVTPTGFQITITHVGTQGPAGAGVPTGGSTGQVLAKASNDNLDTVWVTPNPGDMQKAVYDTDNDGKVNAASVADSVPWSGVTGKPSTYAPSTHGNAAHSEAYITASSVSFATLNANGSVGTGASQVAVGNHTHEVDILSLTLATGY